MDTCKVIKTNILMLFLIVCSTNIYSQHSKVWCNIDSLTRFAANNSYKDYNDLTKMDILWNKSLEINNYDYSEALFDLIFTCIPYKKIHLKIPVVGGIIEYNIISSEDSLFNLKNKNLPKYLFFDSELSEYGDKDKPAHFFGSAILAYNANIFDLSNSFGYFVEAFEEKFELQSKIDLRDLRTNFYGSIFGNALRKNKKVKPSTFFLLHTLSYINIKI